MMWLTILLGAVAVGGATAGVWVLRKKTQKREQAGVEPVEESRSPDLLFEGLSKTRLGAFSRLQQFFGSSRSSGTTENWEALEEALLEGDIGASTVEYLIQESKKQPAQTGTTQKEFLKTEMVRLLTPAEKNLTELMEANQPLVIAVVGINGAGKTTTIGKLAHFFKTQGKKVLLGAGDTFRAGAISQLKTWADRAGVDFVTGREGADPGAVCFDAVTAAKARGMDIVILDTAGRLHTKSNLMDELKKVQKVIKKVIPEAPHETWLVLDGTLGQNSINQAREFQQTLGLTGLVITKLDGTAKGGAVFPISRELGLPVRFLGVGESQEALLPFQPKQFVEAILN